MFRERGRGRRARQGRTRSCASWPTASGEVRDDAPLEALLASEPLRRVGALMAVDADGRLRGVVTLEQVSRALQAPPRAAAPPSSAGLRGQLERHARDRLEVVLGQAGGDAGGPRQLARVASSTIAEQSRIGSPGRRASSIAAAS